MRMGVNYKRIDLESALVEVHKFLHVRTLRSGTGKYTIWDISVAEAREF